MANSRDSVAARFGNIPQRKMRRRRRQQFDTAGQIRNGAISAPEFLVGEAALQVIIKEPVAPTEGPIIVCHRHIVFAGSQSHVTAQCVKVGLVAKQVERFIRQRQGLVSVAIGARDGSWSESARLCS